MGVLGEFLIISGAAAAGVLLSAIPQFPLPGSVTGMLILLFLMLIGVLKPERIKHAADFLIRFLPLFFIPLIVNLLKESELLETYGLKLLIIIISTTLITLAATGLTAHLLLSAASRRKQRDV